MARNYSILDDMEFNGKRVLVRVDYNVPLDEGEIADDTRIRASLPTIHSLLDKGASQVILMSHLGRPKGEVKPEFSLQPIAKRLEQLLGESVSFVDNCTGDVPIEARVVLLENLRFYSGEKDNEPDFAKTLASHADCYVNDAFGTAHRAHASVVGVPEYLPSCAGLLMEKELDALEGVRDAPEKPLMIVLGGAKLKTKLPLIEHYLDEADSIVIGGAMAFTFFAAEGRKTGNSLVDEEFIDKAKELLQNPLFKQKAVFPEDLVVADQVAEDAKSKVVSSKKIPRKWSGLDIGPKSVESISALCEKAGTVIWNGPLGLYEMEPFAKATKELAEKLAGIGGDVFVGGGDTVNAVEDLGLEDEYAHLSTGGGAFLEYLAGKKLPAVEALEKAKKR